METFTIPHNRQSLRKKQDSLIKKIIFVKEKS